MLWISPQWQFKAVMVLSRENVSLPRTGQYPPSLWLSLPYSPPPNSSGDLRTKARSFHQTQRNKSRRTKETVLSFWYYVHFSLKLLYTNLLILYNIDLSRREIMLIRISEGFPHDPIFTFELCQSDKGNMSPPSCYCIFSGLRVKVQRCPNLQPPKCVSSYQKNIFRIIFSPWMKG